MLNRRLRQNLRQLPRSWRVFEPPLKSEELSKDSSEAIGNCEAVDEFLAP